MNRATLERAILAEAKTVFCNPKLRKKDILEWSSGPVKAFGDEVVALIPELNLNVCVSSGFDRRPS